MQFTGLFTFQLANQLKVATVTVRVENASERNRSVVNVRQNFNTNFSSNRSGALINLVS